MARRKPDLASEPDTDLTDAEVAEIAKRLPSSAEDAEAKRLKLSRGGLQPTYVRVWRRKGLGNAILRTCEPPYRRGEPALVMGAPHSLQLGDGQEAAWRLKYADRINEQYPQVIELPIMEYVWDMLPQDQVGTSFVVRENKA